MKSEFKTKLIQHMLNKKNGEKGFTLIELLVVIIIIGILAAIALPSFLNQAAKARQSEAKTYTGSANRSQQAYFLEKQQFAPDLTSLSLGIPATTTNYGYATLGASKGVTGTAANAISTALAIDANLKSYGGAVNIATPTGTGEATTLATLCEGEKAKVNGGATSFPIAAGGVSLSTSAAPICLTAASGAGFVPIQ
ncbi:prepilin-type N-terminal cleavage/methylation domain-containing protein [Pseudanabaena biceps]|nr:prepilin-type N-terminal cleavage/methylation domain-containing protein [Pseudanabaena biceps]